MSQYGPDQPASPAPAHHHAAPPRKKSNTVPIVVGILVGVFLVCGGGIVACGAIAANTETPTATASTTPDPGGSGKPRTGKSKAGDAKNGVRVGQPARDGKFEFAVTKVERGRTKIGGQYFNTTAQGEFVLVYLTVKNIGDEPQSFFGDNQTLISTDGKEYSADGEAAVYLENSKSLYEEINPGNQVNGIVVFDVPKGMKYSKIELHDSAYSRGVVVTLA